MFSNQVLRPFRQFSTAVLAAGFLCMVCAGVVAAKSQDIPRISNFVVLVDRSGSMFEKDAPSGEVKASVAKSILLDLGALIPELGYKGAIRTFIPERTLYGPETFMRSGFQEAIQGLPEKPDIALPTPLGPAIMDLNKIIKEFSGKTAVILVSDGRANQGMDPVNAAEQIRNEYTNICFHVISLADSAKGKENLEKISALGGCELLEAADVLSNPAALDRFVRNVFYETVKVEEPPQPPPPAPVIKATPEKITIASIFYEFDKYIIQSDFDQALDIGSEKLRRNPNARIVIEGHTDSIGSKNYNQRLSELRAKAVYDYFIKKGVDASRMTMIGYGETKPAGSNLTKEGRAINRRVEIVVVQ